MALFCPLWFCVHWNSAAPVMGTSETWIDIWLLWPPLPVMGFATSRVMQCLLWARVNFLSWVIHLPSRFSLSEFGPFVDRVAQRLSCRFLGES